MEGGGERDRGAQRETEREEEEGRRRRRIFRLFANFFSPTFAPSLFLFDFGHLGAAFVLWRIQDEKLPPGKLLRGEEEEDRALQAPLTLTVGALTQGTIN